MIRVVGIGRVDFPLLCSHLNFGIFGVILGERGVIRGGRVEIDGGLGVIRGGLLDIFG
jgi:hypothetical protein